MCSRSHCYYSTPTVDAPTGCTNPSCGVSSTKCPRCDFAFVEAPYDVCDSCPHVCDVCSTIVDKLVEYKSNTYACLSCLSKTDVKVKYQEHREFKRKTREAKEKQVCNIHGCTNKFVVDMPGRVWCPSCKWKIQNGFCPSCNRNGEELDEALKMCPSCVTFYLSERYSMADTNAYYDYKCACGNYSTEFEGKICDEQICIDLHSAELCPECGQNLKRGQQPMCFPCFKRKNQEP